MATASATTILIMMVKMLMTLMTNADTYLINSLINFMSDDAVNDDDNDDND